MYFPFMSLFRAQGSCDKEDGTTLWLIVIRLYMWRFPPKGDVYPGIAAVWKALDRSLTLACLPVAALLDQGIVLASLHALLSTDPGVEVFKQRGVLARIPAGSCAWVPYGWIALPVVWEEETPTAGAMFEYIPFFNASMAKEILEEAWKAIATFNTKITESPGADPVKRATAETWNKFKKSLEG